MNVNQRILAICTLTAALIGAATAPALADQHVSVTPQDSRITGTPQENHATVTPLDAHVTGAPKWGRVGTWGPYKNGASRTKAYVCLKQGAAGQDAGTWSDWYCQAEGAYVYLYANK
ncbi:hypothetical protein ADL12_44895 [Streptomyces regalis]|uniref:Uncharacterized protein n=2 Tax=Streptomyces regalis TaxID=68262 RepID=A0A101J6Y6_9ACTN|nr:hypothetical protein ADL12_44895 [Streptomyces regalis]